MRVCHLGLPVADQDRSLRFYLAHFGFDSDSARRFPDGTVIVRDAEGFDLALHPVSEVGPAPEFLHFGFRLGSAGEVRALRARVAGAGVPVIEDCDEPGLVSFKCTDPDGHRIEVYWEPS